MQCRITTLAENTSGKPHITGEWGFWALVETNEVSVLLDSGAGPGVIHNAEHLGVASNKIDKIGVSHCTGVNAGAMMASEFGDRFFFNTAGTIITVE